jgi:hypothetical protein|tara:strand:+ start:370 stop:876 length:507 start_codon:yes stop_codon:yes gene_type:complete
MKLSSFKKSTKNISFNIIFALGLIVIIAVLYKYNNNKFGKIDSFHTKSPIGSNLNEELYEEDNIINTNTKVSGIVTNPVKNGNISTNPNDLLPNNSNEWSDLNNVSKDLKNINLLSAGHHYGINTVGSSLRNPNLQIRSEPIIPKSSIGPWNNTTIEADTTRRSLEIE